MRDGISICINNIFGYAESGYLIFRNIDDCRYFAVRINDNERVPTLQDGKVVSGKKYIAVCQPTKVNPKRERVF